MRNLTAGTILVSVSLLAIVTLYIGAIRTQNAVYPMFILGPLFVWGAVFTVLGVGIHLLFRRD